MFEALLIVDEIIKLKEGDDDDRQSKVEASFENFEGGSEEDDWDDDAQQPSQNSNDPKTTPVTSI